VRDTGLPESSQARPESARSSWEFKRTVHGYRELFLRRGGLDAVCPSHLGAATAFDRAAEAMGSVLHMIDRLHYINLGVEMILMMLGWRILQKRGGARVIVNRGRGGATKNRR
jgi:hypothetical protein